MWAVCCCSATKDLLHKLAAFFFRHIYFFRSHLMIATLCSRHETNVKTKSIKSHSSAKLSSSPCGWWMSSDVVSCVLLWNFYSFFALNKAIIMLLSYLFFVCRCCCCCWACLNRVDEVSAESGRARHDPPTLDSKNNSFTQLTES